MAGTLFGIPPPLREISEQNLKLAHAAYEEFLDFLTKAMDAWIEAMSPNPMTAGFKEVQGQAPYLAWNNADSAFALSALISNAQIAPETLTLQMQIAHEWMQVFTAQTQEIYGLIQKVLKTESDASGIGAGTTGVNPIITGFMAIQERSAGMAKKNTEAALILVEKIGKAQTIQDILTLRAQFARKRMEAYVAQAQDLRQFIHQLQQTKPPTYAAA